MVRYGRTCSVGEQPWRVSMTLDAGVRLNGSREGVSYICTDGTCTLDVRLGVVVDIVTQHLASRDGGGGDPSCREAGLRDLPSCLPVAHDP